MTKAKVMEALGDPGLGLVVMQMIELPRGEQRGEDGCRREPGEGRVKERLGHKPQGGRVLHGIGGAFSESSIREHGVSHVQLLTDISGLWKKEQFLIEKPAGEATFLGKSQVPVSEREKELCIEESEETGSLFTEELVLQGRKPTAVGEQAHARGKTSCV